MRLTNPGTEPFLVGQGSISVIWQTSTVAVRTTRRDRNRAKLQDRHPAADRVRPIGGGLRLPGLGRRPACRLTARRGEPCESGRTSTLRSHWSPNDELAGGDGLGPVFNARSCMPFARRRRRRRPAAANVITFEAKPTPTNPPAGGLISQVLGRGSFPRGDGADANSSRRRANAKCSTVAATVHGNAHRSHRD